MIATVILRTVVGKGEGVRGSETMVREKEDLSDGQGTQRKFE